MRISDWSPDVCSSDLAFVQAEFAADHLVLRQSVSVDVDTFDIDAGGILHLEGKPHGEIVFIASEFGIDLRKSITEKTRRFRHGRDGVFDLLGVVRSEEHTSELQSLMRISYAVFCLKKK